MAWREGEEWHGSGGQRRGSTCSLQPGGLVPGCVGEEVSRAGLKLLLGVSVCVVTTQLQSQGLD
jgi:hypothetical protein